MLRVAALFSILFLSGCAGLGTVDLDRFQDANGQTIVLSRLRSANIYFLKAPGSAYGALHLRLLDGLANATVQRALIANGRAIVLVHGSRPSCPEQYFVLTNRLPTTGTVGVPGCDKSYELLPQPNGSDVIVRQTRSPAPIYFAFHDDNLYGPAQLPRMASRGKPAASTRQHKVQAASAETHAGPASVEAGVDLDNLPTPTTKAGISLDN
jgi:hypothetical protein